MLLKYKIQLKDCIEVNDESLSKEVVIEKLTEYLEGVLSNVYFHGFEVENVELINEPE